MKKIYCVYCIENLINGKKYIGKTKNYDNRKRIHVSTLRGNYHENKYLQYSWNKYGEENFKWYIIDECCENELNEKEIYYIEYYSTTNRDFGYNITFGGDGGLGMPHTEEQNRKQSEKISGSNHYLFGKKMPEETKIKISMAKKGKPWRKHTEEEKKNLSIKHLGKKKAKNTSSKYVGVSYHKKNNNWIAYISWKKKIMFLGCFIHEEEAALAYNQKATYLYKDNAILNEVEGNYLEVKRNTRRKTQVYII